ncbi:hypothetical protein TNCV_1311751 [Trichonephila clavipes]|nr:hypothetical protein TNCV_1311751 [Trichonephila clavipes]
MANHRVNEVCVMDIFTVSKECVPNASYNGQGYYTTHQGMPSEVPVDMWEGVDGLQFVGQAYPTHALLDSSPNDIQIDVACQRYTLNMQVSSGTKNNSSPNARALLHHRNSVVQLCSLGVNGYLALSILKSGENQTAN